MKKALQELHDDKERVTSKLDELKKKSESVREQVESLLAHMEDADNRRRTLQTENDNTSQQRAAAPDPFEVNLIDTVLENAEMKFQIQAKDSLIERYEAQNLSQDSWLERYEDQIAELTHVCDTRAAQLAAAHRVITTLRRRR